MRAIITAKFATETEEAQRTLSVLEFKTGHGRIVLLSVDENSMEIADGINLSVSSSWDPKTNLLSIVVSRNGRVICHAGSCWYFGDPYLGVQVDEIGFLHLYFQKNPS